MLHEVTLVLMRPAKACGVTWGWLRSHGATWGLGHMRLVNWGSVRSTEVTKVTVHRSAEVTWSQMLGECCRLCLDVVHLLKSKRKVLNKGLILNYLPLLVSAHLPYMSWIRIRICISPYGSGSDFYYTNPDPQIRIRICITAGRNIFKESGGGIWLKRCRWLYPGPQPGGCGCRWWPDPRGGPPPL